MKDTIYLYAGPGASLDCLYQTLHTLLDYLGSKYKIATIKARRSHSRQLATNVQVWEKQCLAVYISNLIPH